MLRVASHQAVSTTGPDSGSAQGGQPVASLRLARSTHFAHRPWSRISGALLLVLLSATIALSAPPSGRKAKSLYEQGRKAEVAKDYDKALELYEQAMQEDPGNQRYELASRRTRFVAAEVHVNRGQALRDQDQLQEAAAEFQRAMEIDPSLDVARQEYDRTLKKIEKRQEGGEAGENKVEEETASALQEDRMQRERKIAALKPPPDLQPISTQPINLTIPNQESKVIFETIGKLAGINVLMDPEYQDKKMSVELTNLTLFEALDYVSLLAKAFWKPISHNAIFVTNDNTNKRRDYEEEVVKTFYLTNVATPQEMQEIMTAIRGLTDLRRMFPVNSMNALVIRGPEAKVALAEKVINDVDKPRAEVLIDVLVIETSKSKTREMGITPMSGSTAGIDVPIGFAPQGGTTTTSDSGSAATSSSIPLSNLGHLGLRDWQTTLPGARIAALLTSSDSRLLQSPRVRTADGFPASIRIGDRIPIATGSFQPGIGGVGVNPLVNTQFNFEDVGVNVDLTPKIHNDREISLHIEVEISNVRDHVDIGGISQPIIGQRKITHDIRIVEGEASVMGGLNQTQTFKTKSGVPFLGEVPILGNLFSTTKTETNENEILIVLVPHIVRLPEIDDVNLQEIASGTDAVFQVREKAKKNGRAALPEVGSRAPEAGQPAPSVAEAQPPAAAAPAATEPAAGEPATGQTAPSEPAGGSPVTAAPPPATPAQAAPAQAAPAESAGGQPHFVFEPASVDLAPGAEATVNLIVENATQLFGSPLRIGFDPRIVKVTDITKGTFLEGDGMDLIFAKNIRGEVGQAAVNISRFPGTGGSDGRGVLVTLKLQGVAAGNGKIGVTSTGARNADAQPVRIPAIQLPVTVR